MYTYTYLLYIYMFIIYLFISLNIYAAYVFQSRCTLIVLAVSHRGCTVNTTHCMYSKLPADDE